MLVLINPYRCRLPPGAGLDLSIVFVGASIGLDCSIDTVSGATRRSFDPEGVLELVFRKATAAAATIAIAPVAGIIPKRRFFVSEIPTGGLISSWLVPWTLAAESSELNSIGLLLL